MSKIEPNIVDHSALDLRVQKTQTNNSPKINTNQKINTPSIQGSSPITGDNSFFKWGEIKKTKADISVNSIKSTDIKPLKNLSNEALVAKLSNINISLHSTENLDLNEQTRAEIELGKN